MLVTFFNGTMWTNQVLLNVVIPLWLVEATDAPHWLLAWLFGTNTVMCIFLPAYTSKGVRNLADAEALRVDLDHVLHGVLPDHHGHPLDHRAAHRVPRSGWADVTVTGAELFISGASWSFQAELMDPRRRGEYQGVGDVQAARLHGRCGHLRSTPTWRSPGVQRAGWSSAAS